MSLTAFAINPKRNRTILRIAMAFVLVAVIASVVMVRRATLGTVVVQEDMLQQGDMFFVDLYKGWNEGGYWDHMAFYVGSGVVEATFNLGVCHTPLQEFLERDRPAGIAVRRLKDMPGREEIIQKAVDYALSEVGKPFDYTATATIPLKLSKDRIDCAAVVWRAYLAAGVDLDSNDGPCLYPDDIYFSPKLGPM
jgi:uncharacterized protein YycO